VELAHVVKDLIEAQRGKVAKHEFNNRSEASQRQSSRHSGDGRLTHWCVQNPMGEIRGKPFGNFECSTVWIN
jgi:hypothetical protein